MRRSEPERGAALVVVLLLLAVMSILVAEFVYAVRIQAALLQNYEGRIKGRSAARAGQAAAAGIVGRTNIDDQTIFNNPGTGVMLFRYKCQQQGDPASFLALAGGGSLSSLQDQYSPQNQANNPGAMPGTAAGGTADMEGCGRWSLGLPYLLEEANLDIDIADEQARLNLNAMITMQQAQAPGSGGVVEVSFTLNRQYFCAIYELIRYQALMHKIEISDAEVLEMTTAILDYLDYGKVDGAFDRDKITSFEVGDQTVPMKDGPLDTVDEIRLVPGMTDDLYNAIKDFLTVYPTNALVQGFPGNPGVPGQPGQPGIPGDPRNPNPGAPAVTGVPGIISFSPRVNLNAAPLEVIYALLMGSAATGDRCETGMNQDQAMKTANMFIQSNFPGVTAGAGGMPTPGAAAGMAAVVDRNLTYLTEPVRQLALPPRYMLRFFRVTVTATMPDGVETTIVRVIKADKTQNRVTPLYYREE